MTSPGPKNAAIWPAGRSRRGGKAGRGTRHGRCARGCRPQRESLDGRAGVSPDSPKRPQLAAAERIPLQVAPMQNLDRLDAFHRNPPVSSQQLYPSGLSLNHLPQEYRPTPSPKSPSLESRPHFISRTNLNLNGIGGAAMALARRRRKAQQGPRSLANPHTRPPETGGPCASHCHDPETKEGALRKPRAPYRPHLLYRTPITLNTVLAGNRYPGAIPRGGLFAAAAIAAGLLPPLPFAGLKNSGAGFGSSPW